MARPPSGPDGRCTLCWTASADPQHETVRLRRSASERSPLAPKRSIAIRHVPGRSAGSRSRPCDRAPSSPPPFPAGHPLRQPPRSQGRTGPSKKKEGGRRRPFGQPSPGPPGGPWCWRCPRARRGGAGPARGYRSWQRPPPRKCQDGSSQAAIHANAVIYFQSGRFCQIDVGLDADSCYHGVRETSRSPWRSGFSARACPGAVPSP